MEPNSNTSTPQSQQPRPPSLRLLPLRWIIASGVIILLLALGLILMGLRSNGSDGSQSTHKKQSPPTVAIVEITSAGFVPSTLSVSKNTDVVWVNEDVMPHLPAADPYPSHSSLPSLVAPRALGLHETYTFHFSKTGTVRYHDDVNPTMVGSVVVR